MRHVELHVHYLQQLVQVNVVTFAYCRTDDQVVDIFMKPLFKVKFLKLRAMLGIQEATIMWVCAKVISSLESPEHFSDGEVLEPKAM